MSHLTIVHSSLCVYTAAISESIAPIYSIHCYHVSEYSSRFCQKMGVRSRNQIDGLSILSISIFFLSISPSLSSFPSLSSPPPSLFPSPPPLSQSTVELKSFGEMYFVEICIVLMAILYLTNYILGRYKNTQIAESWSVQYYMYIHVYV